jgi:hypothetical protein
LHCCIFPLRSGLVQPSFKLSDWGSQVLKVEVEANAGSSC